MRVQQLCDCFYNHSDVLVFHDNHETWEKPLLKDPYVPVFFKQDAREGGPEELSPDGTSLSMEILDVVDQVGSFGRCSHLTFLENKLVEEVECCNGISLDFKNGVGHRK